MASQAGIDNLAGSELRKGDDGRFSSMRPNVHLPRTVAPLTAGVLRLVHAGSDALEVRILEEPEPDIWVASLAHHASHEGIRWSIGS